MKILVLGDSHTELQQEKNTQKDHSWLHHICRDYPEHNFVSYAKMGASHLYYDMCIKHAITHHNDWDYCIVQWTSDERFFLPLKPTKVSDKLIWQENQIHNNAIQVDMNLDHCRIFANHVTVPNHSNLIVKEENYLGSKIPSEFTKLFKNSFQQLYNQFFKKIITFSVVRSPTTTDDVMFEYLIRKYGEKKFAIDFITETLHLHFKGSRMAVEDFIKPFVLSKIL